MIRSFTIFGKNSISKILTGYIWVTLEIISNIIPKKQFCRYFLFRVAFLDLIYSIEANQICKFDTLGFCCFWSEVITFKKKILGCLMDISDIILLSFLVLCVRWLSLFFMLERRIHVQKCCISSELVDLVAFYDNLIQISLSISESQDNVRKSVLVQQSQQSQPVKALWKIAIENFGTFSVRGYLLLFYSFRLIKIDLKDIFNSFGLLLRLNSKHRGGIQPSNCQKF